ncbi:MAG: hypothetical protein EZS28_007434 [Streblomastix strix]|uniref:Uncharacterized protein n=1 Tax=Streblomastix strix TaxID=222440 RepID=A0A5J4WQ85_9EUKA|nr:MAG: hypothetical protein EZS28_007434 [Streblomastix strix]
MLFIIFAITTLTFGGKFVQGGVSSYARGSIYFDMSETVENGTVNVEIGNANNKLDFFPYAERNITNYKALKKEDGDSFYHIALTADQLAALRTSTAPNPSSYQPQCTGVGVAWEDGLYGLLGYTVKAVSDDNIEPSITYLLRSTPETIHYIKDGNEVPDELKDNFTDDDIEQSCTGDNLIYATYSIHRGGIVDTTCVLNTVLPDKQFECDDTITTQTYKKYLSQYRIGEFKSASYKEVKQMVARFGVVRVKQVGLIVGWQKISGVDNWIVAQQREDKYSWVDVPIDLNQSFFEGTVIASDELTGTDGVQTLRVASWVVFISLLLPALALFF